MIYNLLFFCSIIIVLLLVIFGKKINERIIINTSLFLVIGIAFVAVIVLGHKQNNLIDEDNVYTQIENKSHLRDIIYSFSDQDKILYFRNPLNGVEDDVVMEDSNDGDAIGADKSYDYSETNVQVAGVDESDIIKTDGKYIYQMREGDLIISQVYPIDEMSVVTNITEDDFYGFELYITEDKIITIGNSMQDSNEIKEYDYYYIGFRNLQVNIYSKDDYQLLKTFKFNGNLVTSRLVDNNLYFVYNNYLDIRYNYDDIVPKYEIDNIEKKIAYENIKYINNTTPEQYLILVGIDLNNVNDDISTEAFLGSISSTVYSSKDNIYICGITYNTTKISKWSEATLETSILKIAYDGINFDFVGSNHVPGYALNQFSMNERDDYFYIATTTRDQSNDTINELYIFDDRLNQISTVTNLGKIGETIRSVRYDGDKAYVVTFRQTDPLYVIDISDPYNPQKQGELEITGFSTYLHPLDENHLLGFGFDADAVTGRITGFKMTLFDVTNGDNPTELFSEVYENTYFNDNYSEVNYNHKALLYNKTHNIIAIPFTSNQYDVCGTVDNDIDGNHCFQQGLLVYEISIEEGFIFKKLIVHDGIVDDANNLRIRRGIYIDNYLYSISDNKIMAHDLLNNDLEVVKELILSNNN